jgi:pimeloyl-ACP methyl ester carboxylesterase
MSDSPSLEIVTLDPPNLADPRPLLFVHGALHGAWCWEDNFMPYFRDHGYSTTALSLRGHAGSPAVKSLRTVRIADYVADVAQVVDTFDRPPIIIAHSMGGFVVQKYLESLGASGSRIPLAVLISSVPPKGVIGFSIRMLGKHPLRFLEAIGKLKLSPMFKTTNLFRDAFMSSDVPLDSVQPHLDRMTEESFVAFLDLLVLDLPKPSKIVTPMLVIGGTRDVAVSAKESVGTAKAYGTKAEIFDIAHDMMIEKNWEEVANFIRAEIEKTAVAEPTGLR